MDEQNFANFAQDGVNFVLQSTVSNFTPDHFRKPLTSKSLGCVSSNDLLCVLVQTYVNGIFRIYQFAEWFHEIRNSRLNILNKIKLANWNRVHFNYFPFCSFLLKLTVMDCLICGFRVDCMWDYYMPLYIYVNFD